MNKVRVAILAAMLCLIFVLSACNESNPVERIAYIKSPDGETIRVRVADYMTGSNTVKVKTADGTVYWTSWENVLIVRKELK